MTTRFWIFVAAVFVLILAVPPVVLYFSPTTDSHPTAVTPPVERTEIEPKATSAPVQEWPPTPVQQPVPASPEATDTRVEGEGELEQKPEAGLSDPAMEDMPGYEPVPGLPIPGELPQPGLEIPGEMPVPGEPMPGEYQPEGLPIPGDEPPARDQLPPGDPAL